MVVVITAITACIAGGIQVWDMARSFDIVESETALALRTFERDVMRTFRFYRQPFKGETAMIRFPGLVMVSPADEEHALPGGRQMGTIEYRHDRETGSFMRLISSFPDGSTREETILEGVRSLKLDYYKAAAQGESTTGWQEEWSNPTNFPERVRITLEVGARNPPLDIERVIMLAVANPRKDEK